ncbi:MFS transporter [Niallia circulans]|uniref:MFS transporter n=1 Tax=Niallia circulans TaxID=1397 RepID=A0A553SU73_NIACI|nr:MFS transporter [Niallia circulans]TRZ40534.1 MFS transporter [Niallia circulans]
MPTRNNLYIFILALGVFGILTTEMGIVGILPLIADYYQISIAKASLLVSLFALAVAISGPIMPLLFSGINRKKVMILVLGLFLLGNIVSIFASNFTVLLLARVIPAFFHPVYCSLALTAAAASVRKEEAPKAVSKVMMGVNAGMILGVPITNFIGNGTSLEVAMLFFAILNALALLATLFFVPSLPVKEKLSYGAQLNVLKKPLVWTAIATVIFIGSATSGVNSFIAEYLENVTNISGNFLSIMLFIFGLASLLGNFIGGNLLSRTPIKTTTLFPVVLGIAYLLSFVTGETPSTMIVTIFLWGILFSVGSMINQYSMTHAAPEAPDFANGLFLSGGNLGITIGTAIGGLFISGLGTQYIVIGGILFLILSLGSILLTNYMIRPGKQLTGIN